jgi:hypothetical protein
MMMMMMMMMSALPAVHATFVDFATGSCAVTKICGCLFFKRFTAIFVLFRPTTLRYVRFGFLKAIPQVSCE